MKCSDPPGRSTRRISASADSRSGIVHIVYAETTASTLSSGSASRRAVEPDPLHRTTERARSAARVSPGDVGGLHGVDPSDRVGVVQQVGAVGEADLEHVAGHVRRRPARASARCSGRSRSAPSAAAGSARCRAGRPSAADHRPAAFCTSARIASSRPAAEIRAASIPVAVGPGPTRARPPRGSTSPSARCPTGARSPGRGRPASSAARRSAAGRRLPSDRSSTRSTASPPRDVGGASRSRAIVAGICGEVVEPHAQLVGGVQPVRRGRCRRARRAGCGPGPWPSRPARRPAGARRRRPCPSRARGRRSSRAPPRSRTRARGSDRST